jgi:hypothetical protein
MYLETSLGLLYFFYCIFLPLEQIFVLKNSKNILLLGLKARAWKKGVGICGWQIDLQFGGIIVGGGFLAFRKMGVHGLWCNNGARQRMHKCA